MAVITDECVACHGGGRADVTFICAVHYADAVVWDQKRRFIEHMMNLWRKKKRRGRGGRMREGERKGERANESTREPKKAAEKWP